MVLGNYNRNKKNDNHIFIQQIGEFKMKKILAKDIKSASYCCEASETIPVKELDKCEDLRRKLAEDMKSASYCCEASETISVDELSYK